MENEEGFTKVHFVIAAIFAVTVTLGSFAGVQALTSMKDSEMSDVTGQAGIKMDLEIGSEFNFEAKYGDGDGVGNTAGYVTFENIGPSGSSTDLNILGLTIDADANTALGSTGTTTGTAGGAIVIGLPNIPNGITIGAINPASTASGLDSNTTANESIGSLGVGGINNGTAVEIQIGAN